MNVFRKSSLGVAGLALAIGGLTTVSTVEAGAAAPCAAENQAAGAARNEVGHRAAALKRAKKKLKRAKKAYRSHHTAANRKKVRKAKRAKKRAVARYRAAQGRYASAAATADRCHGASPSTPQPAPAASAGDVAGQLTRLLDPTLMTDALSGGVKQLATTLAGAGLPMTQLRPVLDRLATAIEGGADPADLAGELQQTLGGLAGSGLPTDQVQSLSGQLVRSLGSSGLSPDAFLAALRPVIAALAGAGLPADQLATALRAALTALASGQLPGPDGSEGVVDTLIDAIRDALPEPAAPLDGVLAQLQHTLHGVLDLLV